MVNISASHVIPVRQLHSMKTEFITDSKMQKVMRVIGEMLSLQPTDRKVVALNVLSNIIQLDVSLNWMNIFVDFQLKLYIFQIPDQTPELLLQTKNYFSQISENPAKTLKDICEKPFLELKLAGLVTLSKIVVQPWGQAEINKCPGKCICDAVCAMITFTFLSCFILQVLSSIY